MPFLSTAQQKFMFANHPEIAKRWAKETPDMKNLPEHVKKDVLKKSVKKTGKGGPGISPFSQASSPIDLLTSQSNPPTASSIPKSVLNSMGKGGPTPVQVRVGNIVRNVTKAADVVPKESVSKDTYPAPEQAKTIQVKTKPKIPYSSTLPSPGPKNLNSVIVPSMRIPLNANLHKILPAPSKIPNRQRLQESLPPKLRNANSVLPIGGKKGILKKVLIRNMA